MADLKQNEVHMTVEGLMRCLSQMKKDQKVNVQIYQGNKVFPVQTLPLLTTIQHGSETWVKQTIYDDVCIRVHLPDNVHTVQRKS